MEYVAQEINSFLSNNITQMYPDYNPATTYVFEPALPTSASIVRYGSFYYRSIIDANVGFDPDKYNGIKWVKWSIANSFAMLDVSSLSKSVKVDGSLTVTFSIGTLADTIGLGYYEADTVLIELLSPLDIVLWSYTVPSTINEGVYDWYTWTYAPYTYEADRNRAVKFPPNIGTKIRITFNKYIGIASTSCGFLLCGESVFMGKTLSTVNFGFNSYAVRDTDAFGTITITKRAVQDIIDFETIIDRKTLVRTVRTIKSVYNDIMLFILDESEASGYENLITLGVIQDVVPVLDEFDLSTISWSIIESI